MAGLFFFRDGGGRGQMRGYFGFMQTKRYAFHFCTAIILMDQWTVYEKRGQQMDSMIELPDVCL